MENLRTAVIGAGKMGALHAGLANSLPGSTLVGIAEKNAFVRSTLADLLPGVKMYADHQTMLDELHPDAVFITSPTYLHAPMALDCARRGVSFFLEKPMSLTAEEGKPLVELVQKNNIVNMVGFMGRYLPAFRKAREIVQTGALGRTLSFNGTMYVSQLFTKGSGWRYNKKTAGGGVVITQNTHLIDLIVWYLGPVQSVNASIQSLYSSRTEDSAHAIFEMEGGIRGWIDTSWSIRHHRLVDIEIQIHSENGNLFVNEDLVRLYLDQSSGSYPAGWTHISAASLYQGVPIDIGGAHYVLQDMDFLAACRSKAKLESDVTSALHVQEVVDALYFSAAHNGVCSKAGASGDIPAFQSTVWNRIKNFFRRLFSAK